MSLQVIDNQPVAFGSSRVVGCLCEDPDDALLIADGDVINFQFGQSTCETEGLLSDPSMLSRDNWTGWVFGEGNICTTDGTVGDPLTETNFTPTAGLLYYVTVTCTSFAGVGNIRVTMGGASETFTGTGTFNFTMAAISAAPLVFRGNGDITACLSFAQVYLQTTDVEVSILDRNGVILEVFDYASDPDYFTYAGDFLTVEIPYSEDFGECFTVQVYDPCDDTTYTSQQFTFTDETCTLSLKACNAGNNFGFGDGFSPTMRVRAKLTRPSYEYEEQVEKGTNGYVNNFYVERATSLEFRVDRVGYFAHMFLSTLPLWDHVYIEQAEYRFKAEGYEPAYGDVWESYGGIIMNVEPKQDTLRKVRCGPDEAMGCVPPPNFLVQRTGPNNDYILLQDGGRIILH